MVIKPTCGFVRPIVTEVSIPHLRATVACVLACESHICGMQPPAAHTSCVLCRPGCHQRGGVSSGKGSYSSIYDTFNKASFRKRLIKQVKEKEAEETIGSTCLIKQNKNLNNFVLAVLFC